MHESSDNSGFYRSQQYAANIVMQKRYQWMQGSLMIFPIMAMSAIIYKYSDHGSRIDLFEGLLVSGAFSAVCVFTRQLFNDIAETQKAIRIENSNIRTQLEKLGK